MILLFISCVSQQRYFTEYTVNATVTNATEGATHQAVLMFEWIGQNDLRYPLLPLDRLNFDGAQFENWTVLAEQGEGEGLALYVWEDVDGDGVHCGLDGVEERAGLVILDANEKMHSVNIDLSYVCLGFERVYSLLSSGEDTASSGD